MRGISFPFLFRTETEMQSQFLVRLCVTSILVASFAHGRTGGDQYYTAAVYEHRLVSEERGGLRTHLEDYKRAVELARQQGADIILFPEYGLVPPSDKRSETRKRLEIVPDPKQTTSNPCAETETFRDRPILSALSCMAKENDIVVVANMGGLEHCEGEQGCPADGVRQLNTNVAFDKNGTLLARYYKERLYYEQAMDLPREVQDPIFETEFGTFAMFICFDMYFEKMAVTAMLAGVDGILFSTMWFTSLPFFAPTQWFQAWALGNNATLLASNIQVPGHTLSGSGIFRGTHGPVVLTENPDGFSKLLVATLPRRDSEDFPARTQLTAVFENGTTGEVRNPGTDVPKECSFQILGEAEDIYTQFRCINNELTNYTLVQLKKTEGKMMACHGGMCCELAYSASGMDETFYLGVSNSSNSTFGKYHAAEENCILVRCDNVGTKVCSQFPTQSEILFYEVTLTANFTTDFVYPSLVGNSLRLVKMEDWNFISKHNTSTITMTSPQGVALTVATLKGRVYHRDPPYIR